MTAKFGPPMIDWFCASTIENRLKNFDAVLHMSFLKPENILIPVVPGRPGAILPIKEHPNKPGLSKKEGQARLMHDLASIELQAMELALRTLIEYPEAPKEFREELAVIASEEAKHFGLCVRVLENLNTPFGSIPVHVGLWNSVGKEDSLLDRLLVVHRYLEGSGLDAGQTLLRRLQHTPDFGVKDVIQIINDEEIGHVQFGSAWYRTICKLNHIDPEDDFYSRLSGLYHRIPRRLEKIDKELRIKAGFSEREIANLERLQSQVYAAEKVVKSSLHSVS